MAKTHDLVIFNVEKDGFPNQEDLAVGFFWGGEIFSGWPLLDRDNSYPGNTSFATPEQAKNGPLNVLWEASEDRVSGVFSGVKHWFRIPNPERGR